MKGTKLLREEDRAFPLPWFVRFVTIVYFCVVMTSIRSIKPKINVLILNESDLQILRVWNPGLRR